MQCSRNTFDFSTPTNKFQWKSNNNNNKMWKLMCTPCSWKKWKNNRNDKNFFDFSLRQYTLYSAHVILNGENSIMKIVKKISKQTNIDTFSKNKELLNSIEFSFMVKITFFSVKYIWCYIYWALFLRHTFSGTEWQSNILFFFEICFKSNRFNPLITEKNTSIGIIKVDVMTK